MGEVTAEPRLRILHHGELVADIPNQSLTDDAPLYHRPVGEWARPAQIKVPLDPPAHMLEELKKPRDYTADLKKLLASPNICAKRWVFRAIRLDGADQYGAGAGRRSGRDADQGDRNAWPRARPGDGAGREWAVVLSGPASWARCIAVAEAARKVACTGATPVAATNCLNFGNPEKPEIMAQFSAAIDGIAEACKALGTPITGRECFALQRDPGRGDLSDAGDGDGGDSGGCDEGRASEFSAGGRHIVLLGRFRAARAGTEFKVT